MSIYAAAKHLTTEGATDGAPTIIRFTVFGDPVPKARPRLGRADVYTPERTKNHEDNIRLVYRSIYRGFSFQRGTPLVLYADFFFKIPKRSKKAEREAMMAGQTRPLIRKDIDNLLKTVADAGNGVIYEDDSQIVELRGRKFYSDSPRTEIIVARVEESGDGRG